MGEEDAEVLEDMAAIIRNRVRPAKRSLARLPSRFAMVL
jgi:hypothetical protein